MRTTIAAAITAGSILALAAPAAAYATPLASTCSAEVRDHIAKTDNGHGTPAAWADLSLNRATTIQCAGPGTYKVLLVDTGTLKTRVGAGTPNGTGGTIANAVPGKVEGVYGLTVKGQLSIPLPRDTTLSSTAYVAQLFAAGATVTGGDYVWTYTTRCGERWLDSSKNNDGIGAQAGNVTGKTCRPRTTPTPSTGTPTPTPTKPGEAPVPTPVHSDLPVTG